MFDRVHQAGHDNDRSFVYGYDRLNRLQYAEYGQLDYTTLDPNNLAALALDGNEGPHGFAWDLDLLGNLSGGSESAGSYIKYEADSTHGFDPSGDTYLYREHHDVNEANEITSQSIDDGTTTNTFAYDDAGNLTQTGDTASNRKYVYDAWNRLVKILRADNDAVLSEYRYDALGRRINKKSNVAPQTLVDGEYYYYDGNRLISRYVTEQVATQECHNCGGGGGGSAKTIQSSSASESRSSEKRVTLTKDIVDPADIARQQDPKADLRMDTCCSTTYTFPVVHHEDFVYGTDYIDEHVAHYDKDGNVGYVLQAANYNVVGYVDGAGAITEQIAYSPYGEELAIENGTGQTITDPDRVYRFQGRYRDRESDLVNFRNRYYSLPLQRMISRDPNEQALQVASVLSMNAQARSVQSTLSMTSQYDDGMSLYMGFRASPVVGSDPSGMFTFVELAGVQALRSDLMSLEYDSSASLVDSLKGLSLLAYERNAAMDQFLGTQSNPFDFTEIDRALGVYSGFQTAKMGIFGTVAAGKLIGVGAKLWKRFVSRAGSRRSLLNILDSGINRVRQFFGFGARRTPLGFKNRVQFDDAVTRFRHAAGDPGAIIGLRGSAASGIRHSTGETVSVANDFDFFIVSDDLYRRGVDLNLPRSDGALRVSATMGFPELHAVEQELTRTLGKKTTIRVFNSKGYGLIANPTDILGQ